MTSLVNPSLLPLRPRSSSAGNDEAEELKTDGVGLMPNEGFHIRRGDRQFVINSSRIKTVQRPFPALAPLQKAFPDNYTNELPSLLPK